MGLSFYGAHMTTRLAHTVAVSQRKIRKHCDFLIFLNSVVKNPKTDLINNRKVEVEKEEGWGEEREGRLPLCEGTSFRDIGRF